MQHRIRHIVVATTAAIVCAAAHGRRSTAGRADRRAESSTVASTENELQSIAVVERKVMMPMRDGVRLATDIYRPKNATRQGADDLGAHAVQLQLLGHPERRAGRHDGGSSPP